MINLALTTDTGGVSSRLSVFHHHAKLTNHSMISIGISTSPPKTYTV